MEVSFNATPLGRVVIGDPTYPKHGLSAASTKPLANYYVRAMSRGLLPCPPSERYLDL